MNTAKENIANTPVEDNKVENAVDNASNTVETPKRKKSRRGISNDTRSTSRKKPTDKYLDERNKLFPCYIDAIDITSTTPKDGTSDFGGKEVPMLRITFVSQKGDEGQKAYVSELFMPVPSNIDTIPNGDNAWRIDSMMSKLKHYLDVCVLRGRPMTEEEEFALDLGYEDFDEVGNYSHVPVDDVIAGWSAMFEAYVAMFTANDSKPAIYTESGSKQPYWLKLLRYVRQTKGNKDWVEVQNGNLAIPSFVGEGIIEVMKPKSEPTLVVDIVKEMTGIIEGYSRKKEPIIGVQQPNIGGGFESANPINPGNTPF